MHIWTRKSALMQPRTSPGKSDSVAAVRRIRSLPLQLSTRPTNGEDLAPESDWPSLRTPSNLSLIHI